MTNQRRSLGNAGENGIVKRAIEAGLRAIKQPMSGMLKDYPADLQLDNGQIKVLGESKVRSLSISPRGKRSLTLDLDWLRKVMREAGDHNFHHGALFVRPKGTPNDHFVLVEEDVYFELLRRSR